jgi:hypothetical protein
MTGSDDRAFTRIDLETLDRLATNLFDAVLDLQKQGKLVNQGFTDDVLGFRAWVSAMRDLGCEGRVDR